jgi:hypothetical protein
MLEAYRPPVFSKLKFNKLFLGNVAPKIDGRQILAALTDIYFCVWLQKVASSVNK